MGSINLFQIKKISKFLPFYLMIFGLISYSLVKEKGHIYIVISVFAVSMLLSLASIILFNFFKDNEAYKMIACLFFYGSFELGFINLWVGFINDYFLEITMLFASVFGGCIMGFFHSRRREKRKVEKQRNKNIALIVISSCLGIWGMRTLSVILNQDILLVIAKCAMYFLFIIFSFYIGMVIFALKKL